MRHTFVAATVGSALSVFCAQVHADALSDIFTEGHVDGELRSCYFSRLYDAATVPDANAFSVAALINVRTGTLGVDSASTPRS
ncbi:MAG: hypothetical protein ABIQ78_06610 [Dokdonella sp.]